MDPVFFGKVTNKVYQISTGFQLLQGIIPVRVRGEGLAVGVDVHVLIVESGIGDDAEPQRLVGDPPDGAGAADRIGLAVAHVDQVVHLVEVVSC